MTPPQRRDTVRAMTDVDKDDTETSRNLGFEARLFDLLPLGFWGTAIALFVIPVIAFFLIAELNGYTTVRIAETGGLAVQSATIFALLLSAIFTAAVSLSAAAETLTPRVRAALALTLRDGHDAVDQYEARRKGRSRRGWVPIVIGSAIGIGMNVFPLGALVETSLLDYIQSPGIWFLIISPLLFILLARAIHSMSAESRAMRDLAADQLVVDLDNPDRLDVYGQIALRSALSWLIFAAIGVAFLGTGAAWSGALPMILGAGALAITSFFLALRAVHSRIVAEKAVALTDIRARLSKLRDAAFSGDMPAAAGLAGLTAYEARLERLREWPISAPVTTRFFLYILIPVAAWLGAALAERMVSSII